MNINNLQMYYKYIVNNIYIYLVQKESNRCSFYLTSVITLNLCAFGEKQGTSLNNI